jgi:DNA-binding PadR family transcriptional regulator
MTMSLERILLGLLKTPASGYTLKTVFTEAINYFWPAELSQIYRTLKRLEREGLLRCRSEPSSKGPDRKVYSLTATGRKTLREWLDGEPKFGDERFTYLAQLFFMGGRRDLGKTRRFVAQLRESFKARLETYRRIDRAWRGGSDAFPDIESNDGFHAYLTLRMGLLRVAAGVKWCNETIRRIDDRTANRSREGDLKHRRKK